MYMCLYISMCFYVLLLGCFAGVLFLPSQWATGLPGYRITVILLDRAPSEKGGLTKGGELPRASRACSLETRQTDK